MSTSTQEGALAPPPKPMPESEGMDPLPFAARLWYYLTILGPLHQGELHARSTIPTGEVVREYVRWHPEARPESKRPRYEVMEADFFDRGVAHGLERGWLRRKGDKLVAGEQPPRLGMVTAGGAISAAKMLRPDDEQRAFELLTSRNGARNMAIVSKADLRKSLETVGQLYPIIRWSPGGGNGDIIVDGATRLELLRAMGKDDEDIAFVDLPREMPSLEVLQIRIEAEMNGTTKDQSAETKAAYIAQLAAAGFSQKKIAEVVKLTQQRVSAILSTVQPDEYRGQGRRPTIEQVAEMKQLEAAGWTVRDIAERTGWSKSTVDNYLTGERQPRDPKAGSRTRQPGRKSNNPGRTSEAVRQRIQEAHYVHGKTIPQIERAEGVSPNVVRMTIDVAPLTPGIAKAKARAEAEADGTPDRLTEGEQVALRGIISRFPKDAEADCLRRFLAAHR